MGWLVVYIRYARGARCLPEVGSYHPSGLFLTVEEVREEVAGSRVASFVSQSEDGTLLGDEYAERFEDSGDDVACGADVGLLLELADLEVFAEAVLRRSAELEDALCDLIYRLSSFVIHLLELAVQREELRATDVPVVAAEVSIVYLEVSEELLKTLDDRCDLVSVEASD